MKIKWVSIGEGKKSHAVQTFGIFNWINNDGYSMCGLHQHYGQRSSFPKCKRCEMSIEKRKNLKRRSKVAIYAIPIEAQKLLKGV